MGSQSFLRHFTPTPALTTAALVLLLAGACSSPESIRRHGPRLLPEATFMLPNASCTLALTIDDAPHPAGDTTRAIAEVLAKHHARATFFVLGERINAQTRPLLKQLLTDGHELANHGFEEARAIFQSEAEFEASIRKTHERLAALAAETGTAVSTWYRPGWGLYDRDMHAYVAEPPYGYRIALGDVFPQDTHHCSIRRSVDFLLEHAQPGSILILHDADRSDVLRGAESNRCSNGLRGDRTAAVLDRTLPRLQARGFRFSTLSDAAGAPGPCQLDPAAP
jgi:peptidoglycan/xylan/chitin deacetylase (PgdA/CDA1 family)